MRRRTIFLAILLLHILFLVAATWRPQVIVRAADAPSLTEVHQQELATQLENALPNRDVHAVVILSDRIVETRPATQSPIAESAAAR